MFYTYRQNNSGGRYTIDDINGHSVAFEANSHEQANERMHNLLDQEYCSCCGERWPAHWDESEASSYPKMEYSDVNLLEAEDYFTKNSNFDTVHVVHVYYLDGSKKSKTYETKKLHEEFVKEKNVKDESAGNFRYAITFNQHHVTSVRKVFQYEDCDFYSDPNDGNFVLRHLDGLFLDESVSYGSFSSKNKKEVEDVAKIIQREFVNEFECIKKDFEAFCTKVFRSIVRQTK